MMKKLKTKAGMSLMEVMVALLIMVLLVVGMGTGMDAGMRVYADAHFESSSASMAGIVNTSLNDVLRYAQDIHAPEATLTPPPLGGLVFTNLEYGLRDAYFVVPSDGDGKGSIQIIAPTAEGVKTKALVNSGAFPELQVISFSITYIAKGASGSFTTVDGTTKTVNDGGLFYVQYKIANKDGTKTRDAETVVRLMNG